MNPGYDPSPLLLQVDDPLDQPDPASVLRPRFALLADLVGEPVERLLAWAVARVVEAALWHVSRGDQANGSSAMADARVLAALAAL